MEKYLKNLDYAAALPLAQQVDYLPGQVISKTLAQNSAFGLTLSPCDKGEEITRPPLHGRRAGHCPGRHGRNHY